MVVSVVYLIITIVVVSTIDIYSFAYDIEQDVSTARCVLFIIVILALIPIAHSIMLLVIRRRRWRIAKKMNEEFVQRRVFQAPPPVINANMGHQYIPPNAPMLQQQMIAQGEVIRPPVPRLNPQVPASLNQQPSSQTRQNMHSREPTPISFQDSNARLPDQTSFYNPQTRVPNPAPLQTNRAEYIPSNPYMQQVDEQESLLSESNRRNSEADPYRPGIN